MAKYLKLYLKGVMMGAADVIPGISGGTIAFITGIYEDFIAALKSVDIAFLSLLFRLKFREAFARVHWKFLASLLSGIVTAVLLLSKLLSWLLANEPVLIYSFFFGLILAMIPIIAKSIRQWTFVNIVFLVATILISVQVFVLSPAQTPDAVWFIFLSGAVAICAMILPGISGAFILVLLGKYHFILDALHQHEVRVIFVFVCGVAAGIFSFVRLLSWGLQRYHDKIITILLGIVIASLVKIWPWTKVIETLEIKGKLIPIQQANVLPDIYNPQFFTAVSLMLSGFVLALILDRASVK